LLFKEGIQLGYGKWLIAGKKEEQYFEYYRRPFIEELAPPDILT
jgi:hypothetical protein